MKASIAAFFIATMLIYSGLGITYRIYLPTVSNQPAPTVTTVTPILGTPVAIDATPTPEETQHHDHSH
ncbi:MAG TPA: hypothetical protein ENK56_06550 [Chloroflexi bacterium]|nr:hypothetical protein [Chloroflexota bacterium]